MTSALHRSIIVWVGVIAACMVSNPAAAAKFEKCFAHIRADALKVGIRVDIVNAAFRDIKYDEKAVRFSRTQPEYRLAIWDYLAFLVDDARIADGLRMMKAHQQTLHDIERTYGVNRFILAALWGIESDYGREKGDFFLPEALSNVACAGRKAQRRTELRRLSQTPPCTTSASRVARRARGGEQPQPQRWTA